MSTVHRTALESDIRSAIMNKKVNACPMAIRLAWHSSGTFEKEGGTGGSDGASMRFEPESTDGANAGLNMMRDMLLPVSAKNPDVSKADIWCAAGAFAVEASGGPKIDLAFCRSDEKPKANYPENGRLPDASQGAQHLRDVFYRMGFDDQEIVILSGAHTLGRMHLSRSGFDGPWTSNPLKFDNEYYKFLLERTWVKKDYAGNDMFEDKESGKYNMLPTDIALITDAKFKPFVEKYAADEKAFFDDFAKAFAKLMANGTKNTNPGAQPEVSAKEADTKAFRDYSMHGSEREVRRLAATADCAAADPATGRTAVHFAAFWGHSHLIAFLTGECKVPANVQDANGDTALHDAAQFGHVDVIKSLLAAGADKALKNKAGQTPLQVATAF